MAKIVIQKVVFKGISAATLYNTYIDKKQHSKAIGIAVTIHEKEGSQFKTHDEYITGKTLQLIKNKLIVQSWRASDWDDADIDSTFILSFEQKEKDGILNMVHTNVPDGHYAAIKDGWNTYYWQPWKEYFSSENLPAGKAGKK
ncbi:MAG: SRPBCC domain-containing protein [Bacteroidota bacterium]